MEIKNKHIFWEALILAIFIFASGVFLGYLLELNRTSNIITLYQNSELNLLDVQLQTDFIALNNLSCDIASNYIFSFAEKTYQDARLLEKYDDANKLSRGVILQHKKYDLLRARLWLNALDLNDRCGKRFVNVVYFYNYNTKDIETKAKQSIFSNRLSEIKASLSDSILLIPIAANLGSDSINYMMAEYNIGSVPAILIDEKTKVETIDQLKNIEQYLK
jgi:hypothetical protein